jgi:hypothetical protein
MCTNWRDLRLAIEECWNANHHNSFIPYAVSAGFIKHLSSQKSLLDRILGSQESLQRSMDEKAGGERGAVNFV